MTTQTKSAPDDDTHPINHRTIVGRRRRAKTEAKIIEAALGVFAEKGTQAAVIDDFIKAAGIARGTFYNYFKSTEELLDATKSWLTDDFIQSIEIALAGIDDPIIRFGTGLRLWMKRAESDLAWCGFVAQIRLFSSIEQQKPARDLKNALRAKQIHVPSIQAALDLMEGAGTHAMHRILNEPGIKNHGNNVVMLILQGLGVDHQIIEEIMRQPLPELARKPKTLE